ncbi:MAG: tetratricopeptide repeat protein [Gammaproteobacteria bacterium]|nr:tetratricopeptide repeat protein [Gammaproteobacteria bacterium]
MQRDAQGHELTGANAVATQALDEAARAITLNCGDVNAHLSTAEAAAPECPIVDLYRAWLLALSNDPAQVASARQAVQALRETRLNERERGHLAAIDLAASGQWTSAVNRLDRHLMRFPHDLVAHQSALRLDGYQGRFHREAARAAQALPAWSREQPGYGIMLSLYGFGLEESADYARAEAVSREAAELEPTGYWPHHAMSHVLEMTGRPREGLAWMDDRQAQWSTPLHGNRVHIWWHKALFHVELGEWDAALALYDGPIAETLRPVGASLCNPTALLWRLETLGCDGGERWSALFPIWREHADGRTSPFNDVHWAMTALRAGEDAAYETHLAAMRETAASGGELAPAYREIGVPVTQAVGSFTRGDYADAVEQLLPARASLWRMGGSTAQRDLVDWTLTVAATRAGMEDVATALVNERLSLRPASVVNRRFADALRRH